MWPAFCVHTDCGHKKKLGHVTIVRLACLLHLEPSNSAGVCVCAVIYTSPPFPEEVPEVFLHPPRLKILGDIPCTRCVCVLCAYVCLSNTLK